MKRFIFLTVFALCAAVNFAVLGVVALAAEATSVEIEVDCGAHATYNKEYQVCFCDDGYKAGADGQTCEKEKKAESAPVADKPAPVKTEPAAAKADTASEPANQKVPNAPAVEPAKPAAPVIAGKILEDGDEAIIYRGTRVRVELLETLSSQESNEGDQVLFRVVDQIAIDKTVLVDRDAVAYGVVNYSRPAKGWGKSGQLDMDIKSMMAVDGTAVPLSAFISDQRNWDATAAGKTLASALVAGPLGLAIGGGMKGKKVLVPKGNIYEVYVDRDTKIKVGGSSSGAVIKPEIPKTEKKPEVIKPVVTEPAVAPEKAAEPEKPAKQPLITVDKKPSGESKPAPATEPEEPGKKVCFDVCKNETGSAFKTCMSTCNGCLKTCDGLNGEIYDLCMKKCSQPDSFDI